MATEFFQAWTWGPFQNSGALQVHHFKVPFSGNPHVIGTSYLAEVSVGGMINGTAGVALACFSSFEFRNSDGAVKSQDISTVGNFVEVENCVSITIDLEVVDATALGGWTFYIVS